MSDQFGDALWCTISIHNFDSLVKVSLFYQVEYNRAFVFTNDKTESALVDFFQLCNDDLLQKCPSLYSCWCAKCWMRGRDTSFFQGIFFIRLSAQICWKTFLHSCAKCLSTVVEVQNVECEVETLSSLTGSFSFPWIQRSAGRLCYVLCASRISILSASTVTPNISRSLQGRI